MSSLTFTTPAEAYRLIPRLVHRLRNATIGIVTYGNISREIARLASSFGANVIVCTRDGKPRPQTGFRIEGTGDVEGSLPSKYYTTEKASLHEFLAASDVVVNSKLLLSTVDGFRTDDPLAVMPGSSATERFIGRDEFGAMKVSRGHFRGLPSFVRC